ncbi:MAG: toll/interleukin-1 receptor domain-containing protein, partial [Phycisphaerae bacterium]|nr:toll/interleukin-1 receptor domain-containing protein [Saprospiraceae bacterium]
VIVDTEEIKPGEKFEDFITRVLRDNAFILTIVSKNSLLSGWVSKELTASLLLNHLSQRQWVPVRIDNEMFETEFYFSAIAKIEARITSLREAIQKSLDAKLDIRNFTEELSRQEDLKYNFSRILAELKSRLVIDVTGPLFKPGMEQVLQVVRSGIQ